MSEQSWSVRPEKLFLSVIKGQTCCVWCRHTALKHYKKSPHSPVSTEAKGWRGSKGHFSLPDSILLLIMWSPPPFASQNTHQAKLIHGTRWKLSNYSHSYHHAVFGWEICIWLRNMSVSYSLTSHLFVAPDLQESTCRMKGSSATCIDVSTVIIVQNTNKIGTLSLKDGDGGTDKEKKQSIMWKYNESERESV